MLSGRAAVVDRIAALHRLGAAGAYTDGQLLDRFAHGRDAAAEAAFAALVERHGPMVLRTCRDILGNEHEALDASQASFLILRGEPPRSGAGTRSAPGSTGSLAESRRSSGAVPPGGGSASGGPPN